MHTDLEGHRFVELNDRPVDYSGARHREKELLRTHSLLPGMADQAFQSGLRAPSNKMQLRRPMTFGRTEQVEGGTQERRRRARL